MKNAAGNPEYLKMTDVPNLKGITVGRFARDNIHEGSKIKSGTDYYPEAYTKIQTQTEQALFENLGNPVTMYFKYIYLRDPQEWVDAVNGGDSLFTNLAQVKSSNDCY